ncbi:MAG: ECF transporter S component [Thermoprotei archaeon]
MILVRVSTVVYSAIFGSLAASITMLKLEIPFPVLPYLKFDFAEIIDVFAFLVFGPVVGLVTTTIHWLLLNFHTEWPIIGPLMKYVAVLSMVLGFWGGSILYKRFNGSSIRGLIVSMIIFGSLVRVMFMTLANIIVIYLIYGTGFFSYANYLLSRLGLLLQGDFAILFWILIFTGIYNVVHVFISTIPAYSVLKYVTPMFPVRVSDVWVYNFIKDRGSKRI